jgi:geranylgeranyl diphosphate synthase type II
MIDLQAYLKSHRHSINAALGALFPEEINQATRIEQAMRYSLMVGGKRIRPILAIAAAEATQGDTTAVLPAACAIEMIHTYSLVHDDLPAMDDDMRRRGQPTAHIQFDEATAILSGDALLTRAFEIISARYANNSDDLARRLQVMHILATAAGYRGMIQGQMLDINAEGQQLDLERLKELHEFKTGALIEASVRIGTLYGQADTEQINALRLYAQRIGLAFQVVDDILNVKGDPARLGKAVGTDSAKGKNTFPSLLGLKKARTYAQDLVQLALKTLDTFDTQADPLRAIATYITERDH